MEASYYFDVLPIHPQPEPLESFTSYLTRLAEANDILTIPLLRATCFPDQKLPTIKALKDSLPVSLGILPMAAMCDESRLRGTTFYHFEQKFERAYEPRAVSSFLSGSVAQFLRYCPACLKEHGYHSLLWRFPALLGCGEHACPLLDQCWNCGKKIPILCSPLRIGGCPFCKGDLSAARPRFLTKEIHRESQGRSKDLEYLLAPQPWEGRVGNVAQRIGEQFALLRQTKGVTVHRLSRQTGMKELSVEAVEFGYAKLGTPSFQSYLSYADYLDISFGEVFDTLLRDRRDEIPLSSEFQMPDLGVMKKVQVAVQQLKDAHEPVTWASVHQMVQIPRSILLKYPRIEVLLEQQIAAVLSEQERQQAIYRDKLYAMVQHSIERLAAIDKPATWGLVSEEVGLHCSFLKKVPKIVALMNKAKCDYEYLQPLRDEKLLAEVDVAIKQLEKRREQITQVAIGRIIGKKPWEFMKNSQVYKVIHQAKRASRLQNGGIV